MTPVPPNTETIYIALLNEGTSTWRPTLGRKVGPMTFEVLPTASYSPEDEDWEFPPGMTVVCQPRIVSEGVELVAIHRAPIPPAIRSLPPTIAHAASPNADLTNSSARGPRGRRTAQRACATALREPRLPRGGPRSWPGDGSPPPSPRHRGSRSRRTPPKVCTHRVGGHPLERRQVSGGGPGLPRARNLVRRGVP